MTHETTPHEPLQSHTIDDLESWANPGDPGVEATGDPILPEHVPPGTPEPPTARGGVFILPWYVIPNPHDAGVSATVVNARGEQVADFESVSEAKAAVARMNNGKTHAPRRWI